MNFRTLLTITFLFSAHFLFGQLDSSQKIDSLENILGETDNDTAKIPILDKLIGYYFTADENSRIHKLLKELEDISVLQQNHMGIAKTYVYYGKIYFERERNFAKASEHMKKSMAYAKANKVENDHMYASLYNELGLIYKKMDKYDSAIFFYEKSLEKIKKTGSIRGEVAVTLNLSRLYNAIGNQYESMKMADEILELGLEKKDKKIVYYGYHRLGEAHLEIGALTSAKDYLERALELSIEFYGKNELDPFFNYSLLGRVYSSLGELEKCLSYQHRYLGYLRRHYGEVHPIQTGEYNNIGRLFYKMNIYDSALYYFELGLQSLDQKQKKHDHAYFNFLRFKAELSLKMGKKEEFLKIADQALSYELRDSRRKGIIHKLLGDYYLDIDDFDKGMAAYQKSIQVFMPEFEDSNIDSNPDAKQIGDNFYTLQVLLGKGLGFEKLAGKNDKSKLQLLQQAKNIYMLGDTLIFRLESSYRSDEDAILFFNTWKQIYERGIRVAKRLYEIEKDPNYIDLAFYFAERSKAAVLSRVSAQRNILSNYGVEDSVRLYYEGLRNNIAYYRAKLNLARLNTDTLQTQEYGNRLFTLQREQEMLDNELKRSYPDYYKLLNNSGNLMSLANTASKLKNRVLIEYTVGADSIFAFVIDRNKTQLIALGKGDNFDWLIDQHAEAILQKTSEAFNKNGYLLYHLLLEPLMGNIDPGQELLIVPDDRLWQVNFDLLLTSNSTSKDFGELPYLIKKHPISYANSANFLFNQFRHNDVPPLDQCMAFSYSEKDLVDKSSKIDFIALRDATGDLPGTRQEIRNISNILPGIYYYGTQASEVNFKNNASKYGVLHLALHGEINNQDPLYSNLRFSPSHSDSHEDNLLYTYEIYNMQINADLAVLSACNTGQGELKGGEGIMSLGRAFQYAGVQSLLLSNWEVADKQTPRLMQYFYEGLIDHGYSKSVALQKAKLKYLETAGIFEKAPFYWGNFMVLGDPDPISSGNDSLVWLEFLTVLLIFVAVLWVLEVRSKAAY